MVQSSFISSTTQCLSYIVNQEVRKMPTVFHQVWEGSILVITAKGQYALFPIQLRDLSHKPKCRTQWGNPTERRLLTLLSHVIVRDSHYFLQYFGKPAMAVSACCPTHTKKYLHQFLSVPLKISELCGLLQVAARTTDAHFNRYLNNQQWYNYASTSYIHCCFSMNFTVASEYTCIEKKMFLWITVIIYAPICWQLISLGGGCAKSNYPDKVINVL